MYTSTQATETAITEEFLSPADFCRQYGHANSTLSKHIHKGDIALHQFSDAARPKINVSEALQVMSTIRRPYTNPALRLVRHNDDGSVVPRNDLFA
jgi:hypothetical protein